MPSLYDKLGGEEGLWKIVHNFYKLNLSDPITVPYFQQHYSDRLMEKFYAMVQMAFGGPYADEYDFSKAHMLAVHKNLEITEEAWGAVVKHLLEAMQQNGAGQQEQQQAVQILAPYHDYVVTK